MTFGYGEKARPERFLHDGQSRASRSRWWAAPARARARCSSCCWAFTRRRSGTVTIGGVHGGSHHRPGAPHLHRLCGTAFCPCAGHGAGADHARRPADHGRDGKECRRIWRASTQPSRPCHEGYDTRVHRRHVLAGRVAAAVHRPRRRRRPGCAAAGRDHRQPATPRPRPACWKPSAAPPRAAPCLSVSHRIYENLGGRTVEIKTRTE